MIWLTWKYVKKQAGKILSHGEYNNKDRKEAVA